MSKPSPVIVNKKRTLKGRKQRYPWSEWSDGQERVLVQGKNFDVDPSCMVSAIYAAAARMKLIATTSVAGKKVTFCMQKRAG
jgi:hypothetical protein